MESEKESRKDAGVLKTSTARITAAILVMVLALVLVVAVCYGLRYFLLVSNPHFICRTIEFEPTANFSLKKVQTILEEMGEGRGCVLARSNLLQLDLKAIHRKLLSYPNVREVKVRRILPSTLKIELVERMPAASLSGGRNYDAFIDRDGYVFPYTGNKTLVSELPLITNVKNIRQFAFGEQCNDTAVMAALAFLENAGRHTQVKGAEFNVKTIVLNNDLERLECHIKGIPGNRIFGNKETIVIAPFEAEMIPAAIDRFYTVLAIKIKNGETLSLIDVTLEKNVSTIK